MKQCTYSCDLKMYQNAEYTNGETDSKCQSCIWFKLKQTVIHTISAMCPRKVWKHLPVSAHHSLLVLSKEPVAILSLGLMKRKWSRKSEFYFEYKMGQHNFHMLQKFSWNSSLPIGVVECNCIYHIFVTLQCMQLCAWGCVPHSTCPVIAPSYEPTEGEGDRQVQKNFPQTPKC